MKSWQEGAQPLTSIQMMKHQSQGSRGGDGRALLPLLSRIMISSSKVQPFTKPQRGPRAKRTGGGGEGTMRRNAPRERSLKVGPLLQKTQRERGGTKTARRLGPLRRHCTFGKKWKGKKRETKSRKTQATGVALRYAVKKAKPTKGKKKIGNCLQECVRRKRQNVKIRPTRCELKGGGKRGK